VFAASVFVWLLSVGLFVLGLLFCFIRSLRSAGLLMLTGSFVVWALSIGMCAVAPMPDFGTPAPKTSASAETTVAPNKDLPAAPLLEAPRAPGKWTGGSEGKSLMDDTDIIAYRLDAEHEIAGLYKPYRPRLIVRCRDKKTESYVEVSTPSQPEARNYQRHTVRLRFDDGPPSSELWSDSTDNLALFSPSGVVLAKRLAKTKRLRLQFVPYNSDPQIVEFDTTGFDLVIGEIARPCGWKP
jgi:hypothetical protein